MTSREAFLMRVRQAVHEGNRNLAIPPLPERQQIGYQGAGDDPVAKFCRELQYAGGFAYVARSRAEAIERIRDLADERHVRKLVIGLGAVIEELDLVRQLRDDERVIAAIEPGKWDRQAFFDCDLGISGVEYLVAETGTVVMATRPTEPRSLSLLPPIHIAVAHRSQILPDLFDLFDRFAPSPDRPHSAPPSCLSLITGPSKTGDIELKLVTGVHGPGEIHVILGTW